MQYNPPPTEAELVARAQKYVGHKVKDTSGREGVVVAAWLLRGNRVAMSVDGGDGGDVWFTTNEFATIVRERPSDV